MVDFLLASAVKHIKNHPKDEELNDTVIGAMVHIVESGKHKYLDLLKEFIQHRSLQDQHCVMRIACRLGCREMYDKCLELDMVPGIAAIIEATATADLEFYDYVVSTAQFPVESIEEELRTSATPAFLTKYDKRKDGLLYYTVPKDVEEREGPIPHDCPNGDIGGLAKECAAHYHREHNDMWNESKVKEFTLYIGDKQIAKNIEVWISGEPVYEVDEGQIERQRIGVTK